MRDKNTLSQTNQTGNKEMITYIGKDKVQRTISIDFNTSANVLRRWVQRNVILSVTAFGRTVLIGAMKKDKEFAKVAAIPHAITM